METFHITAQRPSFPAESMAAGKIASFKLVSAFNLLITYPFFDTYYTAYQCIIISNTIISIY